MAVENYITRALVQVRMMEEDPSYATYGEAYEVHCARTGREADLPLTHFKRRCSAPNGQLHPDLDLRHQARPSARTIVLRTFEMLQTT